MDISRLWKSRTSFVLWISRDPDRSSCQTLAVARQPPGLPPASQEDGVPPRFFQLADVAEMLSISPRQAYALVNSGELPAIRVGGRGQWRVENTELEAYIQRKYAETRAMVNGRPGSGDGQDGEPDLADDEVQPEAGSSVSP
jgi:excisionase family DNA binding protein